MPRAVICVLLVLGQAFPAGDIATEMPAFLSRQQLDRALEKTELHEASYQVALVHSEYGSAREGYFCAGSLITPHWVVTAAHCLSSRTNPSQIKIAVGSSQLSHSRLVDVAEIVRHEGFDRNSMINDIALIKLAESILEMRPVSAADRRIESHSLKLDPHATVSAWGSMAPHEKTVSDGLLSVIVPIVNHRTCNKSYNGAVTEKMICAGDKNADACLGDSGGGLVITYRNREYLEGIVSWGEGCGNPTKPGVYTRIPLYRDWIKAHID